MLRSCVFSVLCFLVYTCNTNVTSGYTKCDNVHGESLNKCQLSNWTNQWDCSECTTTHGSQAFRLHAICCETNQSLADCFRDCNLTKGDDRVNGSCSVCTTIATTPTPNTVAARLPTTQPTMLSTDSMIATRTTEIKPTVPTMSASDLPGSAKTARSHCNNSNCLTLQEESKAPISKTPAIIAGSVSGVLLLLIVFAVVVFVVYKNKGKKHREISPESQYESGEGNVNEQKPDDKLPKEFTIEDTLGQESHLERKPDNVCSENVDVPTSVVPSAT